MIANPQVPSPPSASIDTVDRDVFDRLHAQLRRDRRPTGVIEELLVEQVAHYTLRMKRMAALEDDLLRAITDPSVSPCIPEELRQQLLFLAISLAIPKEQPVNDATVASAILSLPRSLLKDLKEPPDANSGPSVPQLNLLRQLHRYSAGVETSFLKAVRELDRMQAARRQQSNIKSRRARCRRR